MHHVLPALHAAAHGRRQRQDAQSKTELSADIDYIRETPEVRDVLLSGGDPLTLVDDQIEWIIAELRKIPHVEIIRIGSRTPVVLPQRITPELVDMLTKYHPIWFNTHFNHPERDHGGIGPGLRPV